MNASPHSRLGATSSRSGLVWTTATMADDRPASEVRRERGRKLATQLLIEIGDGVRTIDQDPRGKPIVHGPPARYVSISHTGPILAAAASAIGPVGIDIEQHDPDRDFQRLAGAAFGPSEARAVASDGLAAFYRIWTVREAIAKATGEGLASVTDGVDRVPLAMRAGEWTSADDGWLVAHDVIDRGLSFALAVRAAPADARTIADSGHVGRSRVDLAGRF
jgi:4'-phosphopantetheinyl transferase